MLLDLDADRLGHLDGNGFDEIWNSPAAQEMRASILDGSYRHCDKQRCTLLLEDSLPLRDEVTDPGLRAILDGKLTRLETLRDPCLGSPKVHMYDVGTWRAIAVEHTLPSDARGPDWNRDDAIAAIGAQVEANDVTTAAGLCAAVRSACRAMSTS